METARSTLETLRTHAGLTREQLAAKIDKTPAAVLKTERSTNPRLSTVEGFIAALGGALHVVAEIGGVAYPLKFMNKEQTAMGSSQTDATPPDAGSSRPAWRIRARNDRHLERIFLDEGFIAIGGDTEDTDTGDFLAISDRNRRLASIAAANPDRSRNAIGIFDGYGQSFAAHMQCGDIVAMPLTPLRRGDVREVAIGVITGDYDYQRENPTPSLRHRRTVEWLRIAGRADLDEDLRLTINAPGTLFRFGAPDAGVRLRRAAE